jgi:hypothetical protein
MEQRMYSAFYFKLGKARIETYKKLQTICGDEVLSYSSVLQWSKAVAFNLYFSRTSRCNFSSTFYTGGV